MVIATVTWLLLDSSHWSLINDRLGDNNDSRSLLEANDALLKQNKELQDRVLMFERTTEVDKETATLLQEEMIALQNEIYRLKRELEFYQGVMDSARQITGMDVHGIHVEPLNRENQYLIKLVLTRAAKSDKVMTGGLDINIEGMQNNRKIRLNLARVSIDEKPDMTFELKNFARVEYQLELPADFLAERVLVQVSPKDKNELAISKVYDWPL
jgi:hypothetical protein